MATEPQPVVSVEKPDVDNMSPLDAFYHIFTIDQHSYETEDEYKERQTAREVFISSLEEAGMTPSEYLMALQKRYGN